MLQQMIVDLPEISTVLSILGIVITSLGLRTTLYFESLIFDFKIFLTSLPKQLIWECLLMRFLKINDDVVYQSENYLFHFH